MKILHLLHSVLRGIQECIAVCPAPRWVGRSSNPRRFSSSNKLREYFEGAFERANLGRRAINALLQPKPGLHQDSKLRIAVAARDDWPGRRRHLLLSTP